MLNIEDFSYSIKLAYKDNYHPNDHKKNLSLQQVLLYFSIQSRCPQSLERNLKRINDNAELKSTH
jgi:hypothetical protein